MQIERLDSSVLSTCSSFSLRCFHRAPAAYFSAYPTMRGNLCVSEMARSINLYTVQNSFNTLYKINIYWMPILFYSSMFGRGYLAGYLFLPRRGAAHLETSRISTCCTSRNHSHFSCTSRPIWSHQMTVFSATSHQTQPLLFHASYILCFIYTSQM